MDAVEGSSVMMLSACILFILKERVLLVSAVRIGLLSLAAFERFCIALAFSVGRC